MSAASAGLTVRTPVSRAAMGFGGAAPKEEKA
jgi:hypothetical protein